MKRFVYINGAIVSAQRACVSVFDRGFNYGDGLFETLRAVDGVPAFMNEHLKRLKSGMSLIGMPRKALCAFEIDLRDGAVEKLLLENKLIMGEAYLKIIVTRGVDPAGHLPSPGAPPTVIITAKPLDQNLIDRARAKGFSAVTTEAFAPVMPGVKTLNYLPNVLARVEAGKKGADEAIFVTKESLVTEGTSTNVFVFKDGVLITPPLGGKLHKGVLPGITRAAVLRIARSLRFPFKEAAVTLTGLQAADEAFLTNSILGIVPLVKLDSRKIGSGRPGFATSLFQESFAGYLTK